MGRVGLGGGEPDGEHGVRGAAQRLGPQPERAEGADNVWLLGKLVDSLGGNILAVASSAERPTAARSRLSAALDHRDFPAIAVKEPNRPPLWPLIPASKYNVLVAPADPPFPKTRARRPEI